MKCNEITTAPTSSETTTNPFGNFIPDFSPMILLLACTVITWILISFTRKKFR